MFKHDTMQRYVADSLRKQRESEAKPADEPFGFFTRRPGVLDTGGTVVQFRPRSA